MKSTYKLFIVCCFLAASCSFQSKKSVCLKDICVKVNVADTEKARTKGLMFREKLGEKEGMLFIFPEEDIYSFWMKNTKIALDMLWIDKNKRIADIKTHVQPCLERCPDLVPRRKAQYVLEVNSGFVHRNKIKIGDKVRF